MPVFAANLGGSCGTRLNVAPGRKSNRLRVQRFAVAFAPCFALELLAGAGLRRRGRGRLCMMRFRNTPGETSQFTHGDFAQ